MKEIKIEVTGIKESQVKFQGNAEKFLDYKDLIEAALDIIPQGGFTPKDIRDRNRIQEALDKVGVDGVVKLEDADYDNLDKIIKDSRWLIRNKDITKFLRNFEDGTYKKPEPEKTSKKK